MHDLAMAASAFFSQLGHFLSFLREHPKLSFLLLLLLSPPIYRILLYFTPLLLSTALCFFALITLAPYVTATDAEVERQSLLGAGSYQRKSKTSSTTSPSKGERDLHADGNGKSSLPSSVLPSSSSLSAPSGLSVCPSGSASPSFTGENSWISWMKGLNDIGRAWVESKLAEQGLALSEPANRETLLALIEGSFAEFVTVKDTKDFEVFSVKANDIDEDQNVMQLKDMDDGLPRKDDVECGADVLLVQKRSVLNGDTASTADDDVQTGLEVVCVKESLPTSVTNSQVDEHARANEHLVGAHGGASDSSRAVKRAPELKDGLNDADLMSSKQSDKPLAPHESDSSVNEAIVDVPQTRTIMPKTPSRIPAPSKLLEASRRIFSKEEQSKSMLPRAPFQLSGRFQSPKPTTGSTAQSKLESTVGAMKLPRKFLERSKSMSGKEGTKLGVDSSTDKLTSGKVDEEARVACQGKATLKRNVGKCEEDDSVKTLASGFGDDMDEINGEGPKFDEDLEVEEAQALVQSELKMLEVELEEVAAKLPKLEEALAYQKTPVKSTTSAATMLSPPRTPLRSDIALFSAIPSSK